MENNYPIGALCGRFQVHELHQAHRYIIDQVVDNHKKVILFLGVTKTAGTKKNPLDFETRKRMIQKHYPDITIISLPDFGDDKRWSQEMDKRIREIYPVGDVLMYGGRDSFIPYYKNGGGQFNCKELEQHTFVSGTEVRKIVSEQVKESSDFRAGVIYQSYNQFPKVHPCVDIVPFNEDGTKILLARKPNEDGWRFIGGFAHPNDQSYEMTGRRKLREEAGLIEIGDIRYVTSLKVDDWRYHSEEDKILTILFKCKYVFGRIEPSQEISELKWFDISLISEKDMVKEHKELIVILKEIEKYSVYLYIK
jgi:bifunctional NMN adenylyltransferase/nudix hydrolase